MRHSGFDDIWLTLSVDKELPDASAYQELCVKRPGSVDAFQDIDHIVRCDAKCIQADRY